MPVSPDPDHNLVRALSDFWVAFFRDTANVEAYYEGAQINLGQLYLELFETALSGSLASAPLHARQYFKLYRVRESDLRFVEGPATVDDRWRYRPLERVAALRGLMNRVVSPTAVWEERRDYDVVDGGLAFHDDPFTTTAPFPVRTIPVVFPMAYKDPLARAWSLHGVNPGDRLRVRIRNGSPIIATISRVETDELALASAPEALAQVLNRADYALEIRRTPHDAAQVGVELVAAPTNAAELGAPTVTAATTDVTLTSLPQWQGAWTATTLYDIGDLVTEGGVTYRARAAHASDLSFDAMPWAALDGQYLYLRDDSVATNSSFARIDSSAAGVLTLARPTDFSATAGTLTAWVVDFGDDYGDSPSLPLRHTCVDPIGFSLTGRRLAPITVGGVTHAAGENLALGVDYALDGDTGEVKALSVWDPLVQPRATYRYELSLATQSFDYRSDVGNGAWTTATAYEVGDIVTSGTPSVTYACKTAHTSGGAFAGVYWKEFVEPVSRNVTRQVREMALWGTDVYLDRQTLQENFGVLLGYYKPTSEAYRALLRGVSQLYLLGPVIERFESALNVMAGYPVIRDDSELLTAYDSGIAASGSDGEFIDGAAHRNGSLDSGTSLFTSATLGALASDVGAMLKTRVDGEEAAYVIASYVDATTVEVSPVPPADAVNVTWSYEHLAMNRRFRVSGAGYRFTDDDVNGYVQVATADHAKNIGSFRILAVENPLTVILETPYGFHDEASLSWALTRTNRQRVTTSRAVYDFPMAAPLRTDVVDSASINVLTFDAFEALTTAFQVIDTVRDPSWWHNITIPQEILKLSTDVQGRRRVTPRLVEHVYGALDGATHGDFGVRMGADDEGRQGIQRAGTATWAGGSSLTLTFDSGVPVARAKDVNKYLVVRTARFKGSYKLRTVSSDGLTLELDYFPPPEASAVTPPQVLDVELPPLIFRRTVAFVLMDRFLQYHAVKIQIDPRAPLTADFVAEAVSLVKEANPSHTFVYMEPVTTFTEQLTITEFFELMFGPKVVEQIFFVDNMARHGGELQYGDHYSTASFTQAISASPATSALLAPSGLSGTVRTYFVFGRFDDAARVDGTDRRPVEGLDYTLDYETGDLVLTATLDAGADFYYRASFLRLRNPGDPLDPGETPIVYGGQDPTIRRGSTWGADDIGWVDRPIQLTIS